MGGRLEKKHKKWKIRKRVVPRFPCPNCGKKFGEKESGHFVPPSLGDPGFFICEKRINGS